MIKQLLLVSALALPTVASATELFFLESEQMKLFVLGDSFRYGNRKAMADFRHIEKATGIVSFYTIIVDTDACMGKYEGKVYVAENKQIVVTEYWNGGSRNPRVIDMQSMLICRTYQKSINLRWY